MLCFIRKYNPDTIFLALPELLSNIEKHAQATKVIFSLINVNSRLRLSVTDNGKGFVTETNMNTDKKQRKCLGLTHIQERTVMIGGEVNFKSTPGKGTTVSVTVPIDLPNSHIHYKLSTHGRRSEEVWL